MTGKENRKLMEDIDAERRATLRPEEIRKLEEGEAIGRRAVETYSHAEDAEDMWTQYKLALSKEEFDALRADNAKYDALSRLFFGAKDKAEMQSYLGRPVNELFAIMAERDMKSLEQEG